MDVTRQNLLHPFFKSPTSGSLYQVSKIITNNNLTTRIYYCNNIWNIFYNSFFNCVYSLLALCIYVTDLATSLWSAVAVHWRPEAVMWTPPRLENSVYSTPCFYLSLYWGRILILSPLRIMCYWVQYIPLAKYWNASVTDPTILDIHIFLCILIKLILINHTVQKIVQNFNSAKSNCH